MNLKKKSGFTVLEVLIAISLGAVLLAIIITIFSNNKRAYQQNNQTIELQNYINFSMTMLTEELTNVGFYGSILYRDTVNISGITISGNDCTGTAVGTAGVDLISTPAAALELAMPLWGSQVTASLGSNEANCIVNALPGSDYIVLKSVVGETTDDANLGNEIYLRTGKDIGQLFIGPSTGTVAITNSANMNWQYQNHIFYISSAFQLVRKTLTRADSTTLTWQDQVLVGSGVPGEAGIEDMQILYGVDRDNDGIANYFVDASGISVSPENLWYKVVAVKVFILGRSAIDRSYTDTKTYQLGDKTILPASLEDNYHRKVFSTTILLRNNWYLVRGNI